MFDYPACMAAKPREKKPFPLRLAILLGVLTLVVLVVSVVDFDPDLSHLEARILAGPEKGHYFEVSSRLANRAKTDNGSLIPVPTSGSVDNLSRLVASKDRCDVHFALVQDGIAPGGQGLELFARLPQSESLFLLGKDADAITRFSELRGKRIGIGPTDSGTSELMRRIFDDEDFKSLSVTLANMNVDEQVAALKEGTLDLAAFVLDEDSALIRDLVRNHHMQLATFEHIDVVARKFDYLWHGRIGAGQYDPIGVRPAADKRVLRVDTLVVGNGCASRSEEIAMLTLLRHEFPKLIEHNRQHGQSHIYPSAGTSQRFFEEGGAGFVDQHVPWVTSIMPLANWFYVIMALSLVMNGMTFWHRFRLWRIDANRDKAEDLVRELFGRHLTATEIQELEADAEHAGEESLALLDRAVADLTRLRERCQKQANSMLVPMGQEGSYRFQEDQMEATLAALRSYRKRAVDLRDSGD